MGASNRGRKPQSNRKGIIIVRLQWNGSDQNQHIYLKPGFSLVDEHYLKIGLKQKSVDCHIKGVQNHIFNDVYKGKKINSTVKNYF